MRILFTFVGGHGHFEPLLPVARAAGTMGHGVAFGCAPSMVPAVEAAGFTAFAIGSGTNRAPERTPLRPLDSEREDRDLQERFARRAAAFRVPHIMALCTGWKPSVLVCDETDFGAVVGAERLGLPFATVLVIAAGSFIRTEVVGEALNELRAENGLAADPELEMLSRYLVLAPFPQSFRDPAHPLPATAHSFQPWILESTEDAAPPWSSALPGAPTVYFTLGTIFNLESGDLLERVLTGLRELPSNLVVTVGHQVDPAELGSQPRNVHIERYIPQSTVLPYCDLVVSHGGSGSVIGALAHGLPSVLLPLGADQPLNAERCAALGVARVLDAMEATPERVRAAAADVITDAAYRRNAEGLSIVQSHAVFRHLARSFGWAGSSQAHDTLLDITQEALAEAQEDLWRFAWVEDHHLKREDFASSKLDLALARLQAWFQRKQRMGPYWMGDSLSHVDFIAFCYLDELDAFFPETLSRYDQLASFRRRIESLPAVAEYIAGGNRPAVFGMGIGGPKVDARRLIPEGSTFRSPWTEPIILE